MSGVDPNQGFNECRRKFRWRRAGRVAALIFLILAAVSPWIYREGLIEVTLLRARQAAQAGEKAQALRWLRSAYHRYPEAGKILDSMADFLEVLRIPWAVTFRQKQVELNPGDGQCLQDYASTLLTFQRRDEARQILDRLEGDMRNARYHHLRGTLLFQESRFAEAEEAFARSAALEPAERRHRMNRLLSQLQREGTEADAADVALREFEDDPVYAEAVAAARVQRALNTGASLDTVASAFERLAVDMETSSPHYRTYLLGLLRGERIELQGELAGLWRSGPPAGLAAAEHLRWLLSRRGKEPVVEALKGVGSDGVRARELVLLEAELCVERQWSARLVECLKKEAWAEMVVMRPVFQIWEGRSRPATREAALRLILERGRNDPQGLLFAGSYLSRWGMTEEALPVWRALALSDHPAWEVGWSVVGHHLRRQADAGQARRFYQELAGAHPEHPHVRRHLEAL